jgi:hypothetical protein
MTTLSGSTIATGLTVALAAVTRPKANAAPKEHAFTLIMRVSPCVEADPTEVRCGFGSRPSGTLPFGMPKAIGSMEMPSGPDFDEQQPVLGFSDLTPSIPCSNRATISAGRNCP